ncbi:sulfatase-like hydrolase/transferase [Planctomycetaceae bacterium SH139]
MPRTGFLISAKAIGFTVGSRCGRPMVWMRALLFLSAVVHGGVTAFGEAPRATRPHLVLYMAAGHPAEFVRQSGDVAGQQLWAKQLPKLSRVAATGLVFSQAFSPATEFHSVQQAIYSGRFPTWSRAVSVIGEDAGSSPARGDAVQERTLSSHLKAMGYRLLLIGQQPLVSGNHFPLELLAQPAELQLPSGAGGTFDLAAWLSSESQRDQRPICLMIHDSCDQERGVSQQYDMLNARVEAIHDAMAATFNDHDTIFMFTSTHGVRESVVMSGHPVEAMSDAVLRVPLVISWPGYVQPARSEALISTVDLLPTIVELAGGTPPSGIDGVSFAAIVRGDGHEHRDLVFAVHTPDSSTESAGQQIDSPKNWACLVRDQRFKLIHSHRAAASENAEQMAEGDALLLPVRERFIDTRSDPHEVENQIHQVAHQDVLTELRDQLSSWMQRHGAAPPQRVLDQAAPSERE